ALKVTLLARETCAEAGRRSIWQIGQPQGGIDVLDELPSPVDFYHQYLRNEGGPFAGIGKPVLFRGAARKMPAFQLWTDEYLKEKYGDIVLDQVETEKKETRTKYPHEDWTMSKFLENYDKTDLYSTANTPKQLGEEVYLLPLLNCGGYTKKLASTVTWFSSGSTRSVIHKDAQDNIHCMIAGRKEWIFWRSDSGIDTPAMGWVSAEREAEKDPAFKDAYGTYVGRLDVDNVDLQKFPRWDQLQWWNMTLNAGDCAYIPRAWYHFVESPPQRSISVHMWFGSKGKDKFDDTACKALEKKGFDVSDYLLRFSDCSFGWEPENKSSGTKCKMPTKPLGLGKKPAQKPSDGSRSKSEL
ncbi:unnamed protein product, partial [Polarella glacialis]